MLILYIGPKKTLLTEAVSGKSFNVLPIFFKTGEGLKVLQDADTLPALNALQIFILKWNCLVALSVSSQLQEAILNFLALRHDIQDMEYDCYSFACEYAHIPHHEKEDFINYWNLKKIRWSRPGIGEVIFLADKDNRFSHAAIYLGFGKYLSVWGAGGHLEVATLQDMRRDFRARYVYVATPL